ncbi:MAG: toxin-antitoxin system YwqK family antitoxin [Desulfuromonadales bacterium]
MSAISRSIPAMLLVALLIFTADRVEAGGVGYYPNGQVQWEYLYQGDEVREAKWYNESGRLSVRAVFRDGRQAISEGYRSDGSLEWQVRELADGRQEITRFTAGRRAEMRYEAAAGQPDGPSTVFYPGGQPRQSVTFRNSTPHGPARTFYENGQIESEYAYRDGLLDGPYRLFSPEGRLTAEHMFDHGQLR